MPWRYVLEIAHGTAEAGHKVVVVSDGPTSDRAFPLSLPEIIQVAGPFTAGNANFRSCRDGFKPDVVFFPVARRTVLSGKLVKVGGAAHFAYFPSSWYHKKTLLNICRKLPAVDAVYYGLESAMPGRWLTNVLGKRNIHGVLTISDYTARMIVKSGWSQSKLKVLPPGVEAQVPSRQPSPVFKDWSQRLSGKKYLLFMGPPKAIRGIHVLLKAFDMAAAQMEDVALVCLIRGGAEDELEAMERTLNSLQQKGRVLVIKDSLNKADISAFIAACHAVVLPFLLVPSEIPLTVLEVLAMGKPVLISETGGTSEYVGDAGMVFPAGDAKALETALIKSCKDGAVYSRMCIAAKNKGKRQSTWQEVSEEFLKFVVPIVSNFQKSSHIR